MWKPHFYRLMIAGSMWAAMAGAENLSAVLFGIPSAIPLVIDRM